MDGRTKAMGFASAQPILRAAAQIRESELDHRRLRLRPYRCTFIACQTPIKIAWRRKPATTTLDEGHQSVLRRRAWMADYASLNRPTGLLNGSWPFWLLRARSENHLTKDAATFACSNVADT